MKNGKLNLWGFFVLFILAIGLLSSCDNLLSNNSKDSDNPENPGNHGNPIIIEDVPPSSVGFQFDLTGVKAILLAESDDSVSYSISRGVVYYNDNGLFKVLEDNSVEPVFDFSTLNTWIPRIRFIAHSPVQDRKDIFICFEQSWYYNEGGSQFRVGSFVHVKEDGSVMSIIGHDPASWSYLTELGNSNPVAFDGSGNLYFTVSENIYTNSTNIIYKYNPQTAALTQLSAAIPNTWYEHVALSNDGAYVVAKGNRYSGTGSVSFLRLIPTANPDAAEYLYYSSGGSSYIYAFAFNSNTKEAFVSGYNLYKPEPSAEYYQSGLFKISIGSSSRGWAPIFTDNYGYPSNFISLDYIEHEYWNDSLNWIEGHYEYEYFWVEGHEEYVGLGMWHDAYYEQEEVWVEGHEEPSGTGIWHDGYYEYEDVWVEGYFEGETWVDGYWDSVEGNWVEAYWEESYYWVEGHFDYIDGNYVEGYWDEEYYWVEGYEDYNITWVDGYYEGGYTVGSYEVLDWHQDFKDGNGAPDYDKIMGILYSYFKSENIEFRYNNKTGKEAINSLTQEDMRHIYDSYNWWNSEYKLENFCYRIGTNTKAEVYNMNSIYAYNLMVTSNNSLWGTMNDNNGRPVFCQLIDSGGKRDLYTPGALKNKFLMHTIPADSYVYYCADVSNTGQETGVQNIYRFSYHDPDTSQNLFDYIPRNTNNMEVFSFAVGGDYLYFSGTQGTKLLTGKIHLSTCVYTELDFGYKVKAVVPY